MHLTNQMNLIFLDQKNKIRISANGKSIKEDILRK